MERAIEPSVAETFAGVAGLCLTVKSVEESLTVISETAVRVIPGCEHASIALVERKALSVRAASGSLSGVNRIVQEEPEGPCNEAVQRREVVEADDLATDLRWPTFSERAVQEGGVRSLVCYPLFVDGETLGTLCLFSARLRAFGPESKAVGAVYAAHSAVGVSMTRRVEKLNAALESRATIDQAKGIIMATMHCSPDRAFQLLCEQSHALNQRLRDIAADLVERYAGLEE